MSVAPRSVLSPPIRWGMTITALVLMAGALLVLPLWLATVNLTPFNSSLVAEVRAIVGQDGALSHRELSS